MVATLFGISWCSLVAVGDAADSSGAPEQRTSRFAYSQSQCATLRRCFAPRCQRWRALAGTVRRRCRLHQRVQPPGRASVRGRALCVEEQRRGAAEECGASPAPCACPRVAPSRAPDGRGQEPRRAARQPLDQGLRRLHRRRGRGALSRPWSWLPAPDLGPPTLAPSLPCRLGTARRRARCSPWT